MQYPTGGTAAAIFHDLNSEQANGITCVVCSADFTLSGIHCVEVGISGTTREPVFACKQPCAPAVGYRPPTGDQLALKADR